MHGGILANWFLCGLGKLGHSGGGLLKSSFLWLSYLFTDIGLYGLLMLLNILVNFESDPFQLTSLTTFWKGSSSLNGLCSYAFFLSFM